MSGNDWWGRPRANQNLSVNVDKSNGPFGLWMGMTKSELERDYILVPTGGFLYEAHDVPKPHSSFEKYVLYLSPEYGLYKIFAATPEFYADAYGVQVLSSFKDLESRISKKYGRNKSANQLSYGSIWSQPNDFIMGIFQNQRVVYAQWSKQHKSNLDGNLTEATLMIHATSSDSAKILLSYEFSNAPQAEQELKDSEDSAF